jgi:Fe-Mn family superoxide dismutase
MAFSLPPLPYPSNALEPHIDARTMEIHHGKHHNAYVTNLNNAIAGTPSENQPLEQILAGQMTPAVRNNGGGHWNHTFFWQIMGPGKGGKPSGALALAIDKTFGGFDKFKEQFADAAVKRFGSGWAWLCVAGGELKLCSTANQDNPLMKSIGDAAGCAGAPILGLDVWEHAYYLNYQNRRADYIGAWWNVVNWDKVAELYAKAKA